MNFKTCCMFFFLVTILIAINTINVEAEPLVVKHPSHWAPWIFCKEVIHSIKTCNSYVIYGSKLACPTDECCEALGESYRSLPHCLVYALHFWQHEIPIDIARVFQLSHHCFEESHCGAPPSPAPQPVHPPTPAPSPVNPPHPSPKPVPNPTPAPPSPPVNAPPPPPPEVDIGPPPPPSPKPSPEPAPAPAPSSIAPVEPPEPKPTPSGGDGRLQVPEMCSIVVVILAVVALYW